MSRRETLQGAQTMMTKQNDAVPLTEEQLDGVSGGPHYSDWNGSRHNVMQRSNSTMDTGRRPSFVSISPVPTSIP